VASRGSRVEDDRDRPVVDEFDLHPRAEQAGLDVDAEVAQRLAEACVERRGLLGRGGACEARAVSLRRVRDQRELADDESFAARLERGAERG
jgi:hypothetical protein